ncbi:DUF4236 domain-containing protein [Pantanalinema rosaneae CENA516]
MAFRFRRSMKIMPGVRLNLSKRGASVSLGPKGMKHTIGPGGRRTTVGVPGSGFSHPTIHRRKQKPSAGAPTIWGFFLLLFLVLALLSSIL